MCCEETDGKQKENIGLAAEPIENVRKHWFCVGAYGTQLENIGFARAPMENERKT